MYYTRAFRSHWRISIFLPPLKQNHLIYWAWSMKRSTQTVGSFSYLINKSTELSNGIFKYFKLEIYKESKAFKRTRNRQRSPYNKLHKRVSWVLLEKSEAVFRRLLRLPFKIKLIKDTYSLSLITWYEFGASIKNNIHQIKTKKPKIEVITMLLNIIQVQIRTKTPKLMIDQGWHQ